MASLSVLQDTILVGIGIGQFFVVNRGATTTIRDFAQKSMERSDQEKIFVGKYSRDC